MKPLLVSAFFDIGRGSWEHGARSNERYIASYRKYVAQLPVPRYLLADEETIDAVRDAVDFPDVAPFEDMHAYRYLEPTREVMARPAFKALFKPEDDALHVEHRHPEYNIAMLAKWDALERAAALTKLGFSHYVWADFGLGARGSDNPYLPEPSGFAPIERDRVVISARRTNAVISLTREAMVERVRSFSDQVGGSLFIVPAPLIGPFSALARSSYQMLLDMGLATDDQVVIDMCVTQKPGMFHLSPAPRGLSKFSHIHNIVNGLDKPRPWPSRALRGLKRSLNRWRARPAGRI